MEDLSAGVALPRKSSDMALREGNEIGALKRRLEEASAEKESLEQMLETLTLEVSSHTLCPSFISSNSCSRRS
jgi:hypothetical protein